MTPVQSATHHIVRDGWPASVSSRAANTSKRAAATTTIPPTRAADGRGCDLLSRCATSHTRGAVAPRVATRFTPSARIHGAVSTPSASIHRANSPVASTPALNTAPTAVTGAERSAIPHAATIVPPRTAPAIGVA